jgi:hypothetical protein
MSSDPYATTSTVKNILQHVISPKIVDDGSGGYVTKTDLVNIDNAVLSGNIISASTTTKGVVINAPSAAATDIIINVNSSPQWSISHDAAALTIERYSGGLPFPSLSINRSTGAITIPNALTVQQGAIVNGALQASSVTSTQSVTAATSVSAATANITGGITAGSLTAGTVACNNQLAFSNTLGTGNLTVTSGNYTFGTDVSSTTGYALFNNAQAGVISWTSASSGTKVVTGLNSSSIVTVTARNSGSLYGGGNFSVDTNTPNTLTVFTQNSGTHAFNYFVPRF